jgi:Region found in RelA / SpoT proteins
MSVTADTLDFSRRACIHAPDVVDDLGVSWAIPHYSRDEVDAAGDTVTGHASVPMGAADAAFEIVNNWRSSHGFPLNALQIFLRRNAARVSSQALIAQRIKRLPAITHKLDRFKHLKLSKLQDIGGCRAVLPGIKSIYAVRAEFASRKTGHLLAREDDYLATPKASGYRGIHLIYAYQSDKTPIYNGHKVEIQLRSKLQHAWATAVEVAQLFTGEKLKSSQGDLKWQRFFVLMASVMAQQENAALVPNTPTNESELRNELKSLASDLDAVRSLVAFGEADLPGFFGPVDPREQPLRSGLSSPASL